MNAWRPAPTAMVSDPPIQATRNADDDLLGLNPRVSPSGSATLRTFLEASAALYGARRTSPGRAGSTADATIRAATATTAIRSTDHLVTSNPTRTASQSNNRSEII